MIICKGKALAAFTAVAAVLLPTAKAHSLSRVPLNSTEYLTDEQEAELLQNALRAGIVGPQHGTAEPYVMSSMGRWKVDVDYMSVPDKLSGHYPHEVTDYYNGILSQNTLKRRLASQALLAVAARTYPRFYSGDNTLYDGDPAKLTKRLGREGDADRYREIISLQFALDRMGYYPDVKDNSDGLWGESTKQALKDFQKDFAGKYKLSVTGYPDPRSLSALAIETTKVSLGIAALSRDKAAKASLDQRQFLQLINHESSLTPCAISSTGAFGLGQFIEGTFRTEYKKEYGESFAGNRQEAQATCRNINMSLTLSANHIRYLKDTLSLTRTVDAYVGYQQGEGKARAIQRAVKNGKGERLAPYVLGQRAARVNLIHRVKIKDLFTHLVYTVDKPYARYRSALMLQAIAYMEKVSKPEFRLIPRRAPEAIKKIELNAA